MQSHFVDLLGSASVPRLSTRALLLQGSALGSQGRYLPVGPCDVLWGYGLPLSAVNAVGLIKNC